MKFKLLSLCFLFVSLGAYTFAKNSLPAIDKNKAAQNVEELWAGYDPRAEPLDVQISGSGMRCTKVERSKCKCLPLLWVPSKIR